MTAAVQARTPCVLAMDAKTVARVQSKQAMHDGITPP